MVEEIYIKYFKRLSKSQLEKLSSLGQLYTDWNEKVNLVSRKDIDKIATRHILHSLSLAKFVKFKDNSEVLDLGTGGGLPGIPLAIVFPKTRFHLIDARNKKIKVVNEIIEALQLSNCTASHGRVEDHQEKYDFVVTRAVANAKTIWSWSKPLLKKKQSNTMPNGLIALKGGDLTEELRALGKKDKHEIVEVKDIFEEEFFETKKILYVH